jgi:putative acetyltransferase
VSSAVEDVRVVPVPFDDPRLENLLDERRRDLSIRYADARNHPADPMDGAAFGPPSGASFVVLVDGETAACRALRAIEPGVAEVKRMYVAESFRRRGVATMLLRALEDEARRLGYRTVRLETGSRQPEAIAFYQANGYRRIECYAQWTGYALSVCYEKSLTDLTASAGSPDRPRSSTDPAIGP